MKFPAFPKPKAGMSQAGGQGGRTPPQFLADQLTLSRPGGGAHYPHPVLHAPPDFQTLRHAWKLGIGPTYLEILPCV